ncbi:MAG: proton-conducting transporter membrane subunit, partial [Dietzia sp.]
MTGPGLLTALWLTPLVGALLVVVAPGSARRAARPLALVTSLVVLGLAVVLAVRFEPGGATHQFVESRPWIPAFGATYSLGLDGIALVLVLLTAGLMPLLLLAGWRDADGPDGSTGRRAQAYPALLLATQGLALVAFTSLDVLLFYVAFEAMLVPLYFLIGAFGGADPGSADRARAAVRFLLYNLLGGLVMLAAVITLYVYTDRAGLGPDGRGTFDHRLITD